MFKHMVEVPFKMETCHLLYNFSLALVMLTCILAHVDGTHSSQCICGAQAPGDIMIGILLPCHQKVEGGHEWIRPEHFTCSQ